MKILKFIVLQSSYRFRKRGFQGLGEKKKLLKNVLTMRNCTAEAREIRNFRLQNYFIL